ncbi:MAG: putative Holliday junction resolvase [Candidatus Saccharibacteria bacterium]|nr:putative Holliday junction resolvase [Candidatus Saccharibacteria bacterium]
MGNVLALDVGTVRIGVAMADLAVPIAFPVTTLVVDGSEVDAIKRLVAEKSVDTIIVGYPRNQSGDPTAQTVLVKEFTQKLQDLATIVFQDESLTSVTAENHLKASGKPYTKADIDAKAAAIILQDYLEAAYHA